VTPDPSSFTKRQGERLKGKVERGRCTPGIWSLTPEFIHGEPEKLVLRLLATSYNTSLSEAPEFKHECFPFPFLLSPLTCALRALIPPASANYSDSMRTFLEPRIQRRY